MKENEEQPHTSHRPICHPTHALLRRQYVIHFLMHILVFNFLPCSCLSLACCDCFCCSLTFFSKPNQGFDSFYKCCQDALYLLPTFLLCLACWLQKLLSFYSMPLSSGSSPPVWPTIFFCYFGSGPGCYLVILHKYFYSTVLILDSRQSSGFDTKCSL